MFLQCKPSLLRWNLGSNLACASLLSSAVSSCHNRVYQSLANLIRWSDQVMLEGVNLDDKETVTVTVVIKAVLDGVKVGSGRGPLQKWCFSQVLQMKIKFEIHWNPIG